MAYKLNLVNLDIQQKMAEAIKGDKVHNNEKTYISTNEDNERKQLQEKNESKKSKKRYHTVNAVKINKAKLNIKAEIEKDVLKDNSIGLFIDMKK